LPRIPTEEERRRLEEWRLDDVWDDTHSEDDPVTFFEDLEKIIKTPLSLRSRIHMAEAMAVYCNGIRAILDAKEMKEAKRLVMLARREIRILQKLVERYEKATTVKVGSRKRLSEAGKECWLAYQNAKDCFERLQAMAGYSVMPSDGRMFPSEERLSEAVRIVSEAIFKIAPPFWWADFDSALTVLNALLDRWVPLTGSRKGQAHPSKLLTDFIARLERVFEHATGRPPKARRSGFESFIRRILESLPSGIYNDKVVTAAAIPKRIKRL
jgi:hypothetical protein